MRGGLNGATLFDFHTRGHLRPTWAEVISKRAAKEILDKGYGATTLLVHSRRTAATARRTRTTSRTTRRPRSRRARGRSSSRRPSTARATATFSRPSGCEPRWREAVCARDAAAPRFSASKIVRNLSYQSAESGKVADILLVSYWQLAPYLCALPSYCTIRRRDLTVATLQSGKVRALSATQEKPSSVRPRTRSQQR